MIHKNPKKNSDIIWLILKFSDCFHEGVNLFSRSLHRELLNLYIVLSIIPVAGDNSGRNSDKDSVLIELKFQWE